MNEDLLVTSHASRTSATQVPQTPSTAPARGMIDDLPLPAPKSLQSVIGAMLFGAEHPMTPEELREALQRRGEGAAADSPEAAFATVSVREIRAYLEDIGATLAHADLGIRLCEADGRFSFRTIPAAAPWVRTLLKHDTPQRLSRAALETLAIGAYRQPVSKAEIEAVRGVSTDHTLRALLELNLIRTVGRSELPGRPFLYGTTATFLEHFGLKHIKELQEV
ncbi:MAG: SMC-Scp complex subunit ScpB [Kiritimatiellae bacterium]|nr:SMC-Scp complex subunit ScpB [Kiritimatiellia bacterium]